MLPPQASGYDLGKHMMLRSHVVILVAFEGLTLVTRTLLLFPRIDGNGTLQKDYGRHHLISDSYRQYFTFTQIRLLNSCSQARWADHQDMYLHLLPSPVPNRHLHL